VEMEYVLGLMYAIAMLGIGEQLARTDVLTAKEIVFPSLELVFVAKINMAWTVLSCALATMKLNYNALVMAGVTILKAVFVNMVGKGTTAALSVQVVPILLALVMELA